MAPVSFMAQLSEDQRNKVLQEVREQMTKMSGYSKIGVATDERRNDAVTVSASVQTACSKLTTYFDMLSGENTTRTPRPATSEMNENVDTSNALPQTRGHANTAKKMSASVRTPHSVSSSCARPQAVTRVHHREHRTPKSGPRAVNDGALLSNLTPIQTIRVQGMQARTPLTDIAASSACPARVKSTKTPPLGGQSGSSRATATRRHENEVEKQHAQRRSAELEVRLGQSQKTSESLAAAAESVAADNIALSRRIEHLEDERRSMQGVIHEQAERIQRLEQLYLTASSREGQSTSTCSSVIRSPLERIVHEFAAGGLGETVEDVLVRSEPPRRDSVDGVRMSLSSSPSMGEIQQLLRDNKVNREAADHATQEAHHQRTRAEEALTEKRELQVKLSSATRIHEKIVSSSLRRIRWLLTRENELAKALKEKDAYVQKIERRLLDLHKREARDMRKHTRSTRTKAVSTTTTTIGGNVSKLMHGMTIDDQEHGPLFDVEKELVENHLVAHHLLRSTSGSAAGVTSSTTTDDDCIHERGSGDESFRITTSRQSGTAHLRNEDVRATTESSSSMSIDEIQRFTQQLEEIHRDLTTAQPQQQ